MRIYRIAILIYIFFWTAFTHAADSCEEAVLSVINTYDTQENTITSLRQLESRCKGSGAYEVELGRALLTQNKYDEALAEFVTGLQNKTNYEKELNLSIGNVYLHKKQYQKAIDAYIDVKEKFPEWPVVHSYLGMAYLGAGQYEASIKFYQKSNEYSPSYEAYRNLALAYYSTDDCVNAITSLDNAISINQDELVKDRDPVVVGVRCFADEGKFDVARYLLAMILSNRPDIKTDSEFIRAGLYLRQKMEQAK